MLLCPLLPSVGGSAFAASDVTGPTISGLASSTHPSTSLWYVNRSPAFSWSATDASGVAGYSFIIDHAAATSPDATIDGASPSASFSGLADGAWYFHVRAQDSAGNWSSAAHRVVRIDTAKPTILSLTSSTHPVATTAAPSPVRFSWASSLEASLAATLATTVPTGSAAGRPWDVAAPTNLAVTTGHIYVTMPGYGMMMVGVATPDKPRDVVSLPLPGTPRGIAAVATTMPPGVLPSTSTVYVACGNSGVQVVFADSTIAPGTLTPVGAIATAGEARDVAESGGYLYVAQGYAGLRVINLANTTQFKDVALPAVFAGAFTRDVVVSGSFAYLSTDKGLVIIDITQPLSPHYEGGYYTTSSSGKANGPSCYGVALQSNFAYLATSTGLTTVNVTNRATPVLKATTPLPVSCSAVAVSGRYVYLADDRGLDVVDLVSSSNPAPTLLPGGWTTGGASYGLALVGGKYLFLGDYTGSSLKSIRRIPVTFSYVLDHASGTVPPTSGGTTTTSTSHTLNSVAAGTWYFHLRAKDQAGNWGSTVQRMVTVK